MPIKFLGITRSVATQIGRSARAAVVLALSLGYFSYVFRLQDGTLSTAGLGSWLDSYFINALLEHWRDSLLHLRNPISPPMFFPATHTLGYSHSLMLYAPFYVVLRIFVDPFPAHELTIFCVLMAGTLCLYVILRRYFGLDWLCSLLLTAFFCTSPNVINSGTSQWSQTASVFLIPPILLLGLTAFHMSRGPGKAATALLTGFLTISMLTQEFYTGAFMFLCAALLLPGLVRWPLASLRNGIGAFLAPVEAGRPSLTWLVAAVVLLALSAIVFLHPVEPMAIASWQISARNPVRPLWMGVLAGTWFAARRWRLWTRIRRLSVSIGQSIPRLQGIGISLAFGVLAGAVVFWAIYGRSYLEHPTFPPDQLSSQLWQPDPGRWHAWPDVVRDFTHYESRRPFELVVLTAALLWAPWFNRDRRFRREAVWSVVVALVVLAIPLKFHELSFWGALFGWLPGLSAIRDPKRIIYVYELAVVLAVALFARAFSLRSPLRVALPIVIVALLALDWNERTFTFDRSQAVFRRWVTAPIAVDDSCRSFFMQTASQEYMSRSDNMYGQYSVDALFIALAKDVPTLNGYSAWTPPKWGMAHANDADYSLHVAEWIQLNGLRDVCVLDIDRRTMLRIH